MFRFSYLFGTKSLPFSDKNSSKEIETNPDANEIMMSKKMNNIDEELCNNNKEQ